MPWTGELGAGFTRPGVTPWLPFGDYEKRNVEAQRDDPESALNLCRSLLAVRRASEDLRRGEYEELAAPDGVWVYRRGQDTVVALNLTGSDKTVALDPARVTLSTRPDRPPKNHEDLVLRPHEGILATR